MGSVPQTTLECPHPTDFFTVQTFTPHEITRYHILFVIRLAPRETHYAGICENRISPWMEHIIHILTDACDGFLDGCQFLIQDCDPLFTQEFRTILSASGVESARLPRRSPNLNALAERIVKSIKHDCLNRLVNIYEDMRRFVINEHLEHYHAEHNPKGIHER